jgi:uncharacterized membrane protein
MDATTRRTLLLIVLLGWCVALLLLRVWRSGVLTYSFLVWNLILAVVPAVAAVVLRSLSDRKGRAPLKAAAFLVWLCFLPNAPYIATDFMHLKVRAPVPLWFDIALLGSCAAAGVLLGYASVADVQVALSRRFRPAVGALVACGSLFICGFGIYLGRFLRWNSWDVLTAPRALAVEIADRFLNPLSHPRTWAVSVIYGLALVLGYAVLHGVASTMHDRGREVT